MYKTVIVKLMLNSACRYWCLSNTCQQHVIPTIALLMAISAEMLLHLSVQIYMYVYTVC